MLKISACTIAKNEAKNIERWVKCVKPFADEIIVVDTGSNDNTKEIALAAGASIYDFVWCNDFAAAKNFALDKASGDWIVMLDADEYFDELSQQKLRSFISRNHHDKKIAGFITPFLNIDVDDNNNVLSRSWQMRIFRREKKLRFVGKVHEALQNFAPTGQDRDFVVATELQFIHTGYSAALIETKLRRNLELILKEVAEKGGEQARQYGYLMDCYWGLKNYEKTIHYGRLALKHRKETGLLANENSLVCRLLNAVSVSGLGDYGHELSKAVTEFPYLPEVQFFYGQYLLSLLKGIEARQALQTALQLYARPVTKAEQLYNLTFGDMPQAAAHYLEIIAQYEPYFMAIYNGNYQQAARLAGDYLRSAYDDYPPEAMKPEYLFCTAPKHDIDGED